MTKNRHSFIICIDDDREFLRSLEAILPSRISAIHEKNSIFYRFEFIEHPKEAISTIEEMKKDGEEIVMVITDQKMPQIKGIDLFTTVRKVIPDTVKVLLTGHAGLESAITAINAHILDKYLVKPISDIDDFIIIVKNLLDGYQMKKKIKTQNTMIQGQLTFVTNLSLQINMNATFDYILSFLKKMINVDNAFIFLDDDEVSYLAAGVNVPAELIENVFIATKKIFPDYYKNNSFCAEVSSFIKYLSFKEPAKQHLTCFEKVSGLITKLVTVNRPIGVLAISQKKDGEPFTDADKFILSYISSSGSTAINNQQNRYKLEQTYFDVIKSLATTIEEKDTYTNGHSARVSEYSVIIAKEMNLDESTVKMVETAGILHDIGKIGIAGAIIKKESKLTEEEYNDIKAHPVKSEAITKHIQLLCDVTPTIRSHHENYDGSGYPDGISGSNIPLGARILSVADTFDAMTSTRPYRKALKKSEAIEEIKRCAGTQLDPQCVEAFLRISDKIIFPHNS